MDATLRNQAEQWLSHDPDAETRAELEGLLAANDEAEIRDRFRAPLDFGTAGLRGVLGAGPNRMNRVVVLQTTWGLAEYLKASVAGSRERGVIVGYDGRKNSRLFAEDAAGVLAAAGFVVHLFPSLGPTPLLAFALQKLDAAAGIMITASHNPPEYNGYKVYVHGHAQIVPPVDAHIAAWIAKAPPGNALAQALRPPTHVVAAHMEDDYVGAARALVSPAERADRSLCIVYTPMHGAGGALTKKLLSRAGFSNFHAVTEQFEPDATFRTVRFPNPEEKGAMDLAFALARDKRADIVLANDPDADRLAVAIPDDTRPQGYLQLSGNQLGVLLGHWLLERALAESPAPSFMLASIVSSPMLGIIAKERGIRYEETLTGFKWIASRAIELQKAEGLRFLFGYEEALGYTIGSLVRDKDGISAALAVAEMAAELRARGSTLGQELLALYTRYGLFESSQVNVTKPGAEGAAMIGGIMQRLRSKPPRAIGPHAVISVADYAERTRTFANGHREPLALPASNVLTFELEGGSRVIARPSGTEPKIKYYFDLRVPVAGSVAETRPRAEAQLRELEQAFVKMVS